MIVSQAPGRKKRIKVAAHRGASGYAPENTLDAFRLALEMGVDCIELDVHMSRDGAIVVIHDSRVDRTTNRRGAVRDLTLDEIRGLDAGTWFNRSHPGQARPEYAGTVVPTLSETIELLEASSVVLYIEIKDPELYADDFESSIISLIRQHGFERRAVLLSFDAGSVGKAKSLDPSIRTALLVDGLKKDPVTAAAAVGADELAIRHTLASPGIVREARHAGLGVTLWTVNGRTAIKRAVNLGADCIISNFPDRVLRLLSSRMTNDE